jgi:hypothetical protein
MTVKNRIKVDHIPQGYRLQVMAYGISHGSLSWAYQTRRLLMKYQGVSDPLAWLVLEDQTKPPWAQYSILERIKERG